MSRLVRIAAAVLFLSVLFAQPERVAAHHTTCTWVAYYHPWNIYNCGSATCQEVSDDLPWGCTAYCYYAPEGTILYIQDPCY